MEIMIDGVKYVPEEKIILEKETELDKLIDTIRLLPRNSESFDEFKKSQREIRQQIIALAKAKVDECDKVGILDNLLGKKDIKQKLDKM